MGNLRINRRRASQAGQPEARRSEMPCDLESKLSTGLAKLRKRCSAAESSARGIANTRLKCRGAYQAKAPSAIRTKARPTMTLGSEDVVLIRRGAGLDRDRGLQPVEDRRPDLVDQ